MLKKVLLILVVLSSSKIFAEERTEYPELQVTPKASERIALESEYERAKPYTFQSSITISGLTTLVAAMAQDTDLNKDASEHAKHAGMIVGAGWLLMNGYMAYFYQGYTSAHNKVNALPSKTAREQLVKERLSEEEIIHLSRIGRTMKWGSVVTNLFASGFMLSKAKKDSNAQLYDGIAVAASFLPLIFSNHYEDVATEQAQYKKKIFGTISSNFLFQIPNTNKWTPGIGFIATF